MKGKSKIKKENKINDFDRNETIAWSCDFVYSFRLHTRMYLYRYTMYIPPESWMDTTMTRRIYFSLYFLYHISLIRRFFTFLLLCYVFPLCVCPPRCACACVCVIFCLFDFDEPALYYCCICWICRCTMPLTFWYCHRYLLFGL